MTRPVSRATFLSGLIGLGAVAVAPAAHAARNSDAETYVQTNATAALAALGNPSLSTSQRQQHFQRLMMQFADMQRIAIYVVGRYRGALTEDTALRREWVETFQAFAIATYEDQFETMSGASIRVIGSEERVAGRDVVVDSQVRPPRGEAMRVQWRVLRSGDAWKVTDVAVGRDGVWLGQIQQRQFLAQLDQNNGDIRALITDLRGRTAAMRQRILARS